MKMNKILPLTVIFLFFLALGCGPKGPRVNYVEGIVTLDGDPVAGASVNFVPKTPGDSANIDGPLIAGGLTDEKGKYILTSTRGGKVDGGATCGEYNIAINKKTITNLPTNPQVGMQGPPIYRYDIPRQFEMAENSGLSAEVVKGKNVFNFALKKDGSFEITK